MFVICFDEGLEMLGVTAATSTRATSRRTEKLVRQATSPRADWLWRSGYAVLALLVGTVVFDRSLATPSSDLHNYVANAHRIDWFPTEYFTSPALFLSNEVHFHFWFSKLTTWFGDAEVVLRVLAVLVAYGLLYLLARGSPVRRFQVVLLLAHPRVLDLVASQTRFSLAALFLVAALRSERIAIRYGLLSIAVSFHLYFAAVLAVVLLYDLSGAFIRVRFAEESFRLFVFLAIVLVASLGLTAGALSGNLLSLVGDRRAEGVGATVGNLYFLMSLATLVAYVIWNASRIRQLSVTLVLVTAALFVASHIAGTFSSRYLAHAYVLMALSLPTRSNDLGVVVFALYVANLTFSYYYWLLQ